MAFGKFMSPSLPFATQSPRFHSLVTAALSADSSHSHTLTELTDEITEYEYETDEKTGKRASGTL